MYRYHNTVYISPTVPLSLLKDVVRHELGHILSVRAYGGNVAQAKAAMNQKFGGGGSNGMTRAIWSCFFRDVRYAPTIDVISDQTVACGCSNFNS